MTGIQRENMAEKEKGARTWLYRGILVSLAAAVVYTALYGAFRSKVERMNQKPLETLENICWLYQNTYVLYKELYNRENWLQADYLDLYVQDSELLDRFVGEALSNAFGEMEIQFSVLSNAYGYIIRNNKTGYYVTNMSENELEKISNSYFLLSFVFDSAGYVSVGEAISGQGQSDSSALRKNAMRAARASLRFETDSGAVLGAPVDCTVTFAVSKTDWENNNALIYQLGFHSYSIGDSGSSCKYYYTYNNNYSTWYLYQLAGAIDYQCIFLAVVFLLGMILPVGASRPWMEKKWCSLPLCELVAAGFILLYCTFAMLELVVLVSSGQAARALAEFFDHPYYAELAKIPLLILNVFAFTAFFFCACTWESA